MAAVNVLSWYQAIIYEIRFNAFTEKGPLKDLLSIFLFLASLLFIGLRRQSIAIFRFTTPNLCKGLRDSNLHYLLNKFC